MLKAVTLIFLLSIFLPVQKAYSQDAAPQSAGQVFYIREINFNVTEQNSFNTGKSRPFALMYHGKFKKGERITGRDKLEEYMQKKWQLLYNQRVIEWVTITYTEGEAEEDGAVPVDLQVTVADSTNIVALPRPQWGITDAGVDFDITAKARDYNFLGTMSPLRFDLGYNYQPEKKKESSKNSWNFEIDSNIPFTALGLYWNFNFDHFFSYIDSGNNVEDNIYYKNITGISTEIPAALPFSVSTVTAGFDEGFVANEEDERRYRDDPNVTQYHKDWFMYSELYGFWKIPSGFLIGNFGELNYTPKVSGKINYRPGGDVGDLRRGFLLSFGHKLNFGQIDWNTNNFRKGLEASIENNYGYNTFQREWNNTLSLSATGHLPAASFFGLSGRFQYRHWFNKYSDTAGDVVRGIGDRDLAADYMFSLNTDFPFKVLDFRPAVWFNTPKLKIFDLEFHVSPIIDLALVQGRFRDGDGYYTLSADIFQAGGGLELIIFSHFWRSLYLRASAAYNLRELFRTGDFRKDYEIFIGLYHHY